MYKNLDHFMLDSCSLKIDACEDFLTDSFNIKKVKIFHRLDFFSVFLGFDGFNEDVFFDFEIDAKIEKEEAKKQRLKALEKQQQELSINSFQITKRKQPVLTKEAAIQYLLKNVFN